MSSFVQRYSVELVDKPNLSLSRNGIHSIIQNLKLLQLGTKQNCSNMFKLVQLFQTCSKTCKTC